MAKEINRINMANEINLQDLESTVKDPVVVTIADKLETSLENDLPEKYRGKSVADVIKMHEEAEKALSRQGTELGEYRRLSNTLLGLEQDKKAKETEPERVPVTTDDLFTDTDTTINRAVEQNPIVQKVAKTAENLEREIASRQFQTEFPNFQTDLQDEKFVEWVKKSPVRTGLALAADKYDFNAARGLWQMWGEYTELVGNTAAAAEQGRKKAEADARRAKAEQDADLEGGTSGDGTVDTIYDRRKVMELRIKALKGDRAAEAKLKKLNPLKVYQEKRIR